jgi:hypothetical protein
MGEVFLLLLGFVTIGLPAERSADAPEPLMELDGPSVERRVPAWEVLAMRGPGRLIPEPSPREERWMPSPFLTYEEEGVSDSPRSTPLPRNPGVPAQEESEGLRLPPGDAVRFFHGGESGFPEKSALRSLLDPLDLVVGLENIHVSWGKSASEVSVSTVLSRWLESLGTPLDSNVFLGVNVEMLGLEEYQGTSSAMIDARRGAPRINNLSTGLGLRFKF